MKVVDERDIIYSILKTLLPNVETKSLTKLAHDEYMMIVSICKLVTRFEINVGDFINVVYFAAIEAIKKFDSFYQIPICNYIKYITRLRLKDTLRKWGSFFETRYYVEDLKRTNFQDTTYERGMAVLAYHEDIKNLRDFSFATMIKQYCDRIANAKHKACIIMLYHQYSAEEIRQKLDLSRRKFQAIRDEFFQYARFYWNYDNIY